MSIIEDVLKLRDKIVKAGKKPGDHAIIVPAYVETQILRIYGIDKPTQTDLFMGFQIYMCRAAEKIKVVELSKLPEVLP